MVAREIERLLGNQEIIFMMMCDVIKDKRSKKNPCKRMPEFINATSLTYILFNVNEIACLNELKCRCWEDA